VKRGELLMDIQTWSTFSDPKFALQFQYPETTPKGHPVEMDDIRMHFRSKDSPEVYFEVSRHLHFSAKELYEREKGYIEKQLDQPDVRELKAITIAAQPAFEFSFTWSGGERVVILIEKQATLYRVIYDPRSPLNLQIVATLTM
jgi:hypothetical protein